MASNGRAIERPLSATSPYGRSWPLAPIHEPDVNGPLRGKGAVGFVERMTEQAVVAPLALQMSRSRKGSHSISSSARTVEQDRVRGETVGVPCGRDSIASLRLPAGVFRKQPMRHRH